MAVQHKNPMGRHAIQNKKSLIFQSERTKTDFSVILDLHKSSVVFGNCDIHYHTDGVNQLLLTISTTLVISLNLVYIASSSTSIAML
jgi:hypothetical protein